MSSEPEEDPHSKQPPSTTARDTVSQITIPFPDDFIYANGSGIGTSLMDAHISFVEILPNGRVLQKVGVVLPIEHAAYLTLSLLDQLANFEHQFGPIRHPEWRAYFDKARVTSDALKAEMARVVADMQKAKESSGPVIESPNE